MEYASLICFRLDNWEKGTNWTIDEWLKKSGIDESKGPKNTYDSKDNKLPDVWG
jgi:hypothetical protein